MKRSAWAGSATPRNSSAITPASSPLPHWRPFSPRNTCSATPNSSERGGQFGALHQLPTWWRRRVLPRAALAVRCGAPASASGAALNVSASRCGAGGPRGGRRFASGLQWGELMEQTDRAHSARRVAVGVAGDLLEHLAHLLAAHDFFRLFHTATYPAVVLSHASPSATLPSPSLPERFSRDSAPGRMLLPYQLGEEAQMKRRFTAFIAAIALHARPRVACFGWSEEPARRYGCATPMAGAQQKR